MSQQSRRRLVAGAALIVLGLALLVMQRVQGIGTGAVFFLVGGAFLAAYLYRREYGFLIPAGILLGLGTGTVIERLSDFREPIKLGLGLGFVSIYVIGLVFQRKSPWWPLVPGVVLILIGLPETGLVFDWLWRNWPLALVIAGVLFVLGGLRGRRSGGSAE